MSRSFRLSCLIPVLAAAVAVPSSAAILGLPGSTWGEATRDADNFEGWGSQGNVKQGVDWLKLPGGHVLDTYIGASWRFRDQHTFYYDAWSPLAGAAISRSFYTIGAEYSHTRYTELGQTADQMTAYVSVYQDWCASDSSSRLFGLPVHGYPGDVWGRLTHTFDGYEGTGSQGHVNQGIRWLYLPGGVGVSTIAEYRWQLRALNNTYYDEHGPALGVELRRDGLRAGAQYYWQFLPALAQRHTTLYFYAGWYLAWDLHRR